MTRASELLYDRRSRFDRHNLDLGPGSTSVDRSFYHHHRSHNNRRHHHYLHRHDGENSDDSIQRATHTRDLSDRSSRPVPETIRDDEGSNQFSSHNIVNSDNLGVFGTRLRIGGHGRLPGAVVLARERLLERLRGVSLSGNSNRVSSVINGNGLTFGDDFRLNGSGGQETEILRRSSAGGTHFADSIFQTDQLVRPQETGKRPPGLTQQALHCLQMVVFSNIKCSDEAEMSRPPPECGICLESFLDGDELTCLPCWHRFHSSCLYPWIRTCGDCPFCRRVIVITTPVEE